MVGKKNNIHSTAKEWEEENSKPPLCSKKTHLYVSEHTTYTKKMNTKRKKVKSLICVNVCAMYIKST